MIAKCSCNTQLGGAGCLPTSSSSFTEKEEQRSRSIGSSGIKALLAKNYMEQAYIVRLIYSRQGASSTVTVRM